jgi:hypothetical protein
MNTEQKQYIEQNIHLIDDNRWEEFFQDAPEGMGLLLYETGINFLEDVSKIFTNMFTCSDLTEIVIPDNIMSIETKAFFSCDSLMSVTIGDSVENISEYAFTFCPRLTSINIPISVVNIDFRAFCHCGNLTKVVVNNPVAKFGYEVFRFGNPHLEIHGHTGSTAEIYARINKHKFVAID